MKGIGRFKNPEAQQRYFDLYERAMRESPPPDEVYDVPGRHGTTRVYRFGAGAHPVVLLPGLRGTSASYAALIPGLARHGPVYAVDSLGEAGRSVQTAPFTGVGDRARGLDDVLAALGLRGVHLVGGSTGGWHAVNQAIHAPDRLASIALLDPTTVSAGFSAAVQWRGAAAAVLNRDSSWRRFLAWSAGEDIFDQPAAQVIVAGIRAYRARVPVQTCPREDDLRAIRVPVVALFGGRSVVHDPAAAAANLRALLAHAEVHVLPDAGHYLYLRPEDRQRVLDVITTTRLR
ncbi:alpha/beta hydrolase [Amycolatopsis rhabdoformis]|uniref:Alpha/beta hydrolase n=1 Tax=Amycolatopsis rhabdoformis TaxID=1448059 RepID=A0ABZ1II03_9PSEU|nr:alpha/beta hydrolase [Amycolatopsis rhabdoformis]WSE33572.1 alpha/beta hydrolase [Amycolatopsis rhabdoformis]